jgi:hypothetical protein
MTSYAAPGARIVNPDPLTPAQLEAARAEAARLDAAGATTVAADPGAFGYALGTLGFDRVVEHADDGWTGRHILSDRSVDDERVVTWPGDGHRVEVIGWSPEHPAGASWHGRPPSTARPRRPSSSAPSRSPPASW